MADFLLAYLPGAFMHQIRDNIIVLKKGDINAEIKNMLYGFRIIRNHRGNIAALSAYM